MNQQERAKRDLVNIVTLSVRVDATEAEMSTFADVRNEVATLLNKRIERAEDQAAVLGILLLQMFGGEVDDLGPEPS